MKFLLSAFLVLSTLPSFAGSEAEVDVALNPGGSFRAKTAKVAGFAESAGDSVTAKNIKVDLQSLKTGIALRDEHTLKHLEAATYPEAVLISATGKNGQGEGILRIKNIEKKVTGTYEIKGSNLTAEFSVRLSDYDIKGIRYMGVGVKDEVKLHITIPVKTSIAKK